jgi:hypothetical protein
MSIQNEGVSDLRREARLLSFSLLYPDYGYINAVRATIICHSGMLSALGQPPPSIKIILHQNVVFLHPPPVAVIPGQDPILRGEVVLILPKAREVKSLAVKLFGNYNLSFPDGL